MKTIQKPDKKEKKAKIITFIFTLMLMFILLSLSLAAPVWAVPQIQLINQTSSVEYGEMQTIILRIIANNTGNTSNTNNASNTNGTINWTANEVITKALIEYEQQNHTLEHAGSEYYVHTWTPGQKGNNTYIIYAAGSTNQTVRFMSSFQVVDSVPPIIIDALPKGSINYNLVEIKVITNEDSTCKYDQADVGYDSMYYTLNNQGSQGLNHTQLRSFGEGETVLYARCKDTSGNIGESKTISFRIDALPPAITEISPTGTVNQEEIELRLGTDEIATCKWSKTNQNYDSLENNFKTTGATLHEQPVKLSQGINTFYIGCEDTAGNKNQAIILNIELNLPPQAEVEIEKNNSYRALAQGTYDISLTASKPLSAVPVLKLKIGNRLLNIPLEGSSQAWSGYLIIPSEFGADVGEFLFTGIDAKGTTGTEITDGKLVLIDTSVPPMPESLKLANENNKIKLSWDYTGEDVEQFKIYRSTTGNTDSTNYKASAIEKNYLDSDVTSKIGYFYRISAMDKAGNEGPLSEEEFIMAEFQNATAQFQQKPEILAVVNAKISELEAIVQNLDIKISRLEETTDRDVLEIINQEELVSKQKDIKSKIQVLIGELKTYRETKLTQEEVNAKIAIISTRIDEYKKDIVKEVKLMSKVQKEQSPEEVVIQETTDEYLKDKILAADKKEIYSNKVKELQEKFRVQQELASYEISYEYKESQRIILVTENIISSMQPNELQGVIAQEFIPKETLKVSEIIFEVTPEGFNRLGAQWPLNPDYLEITYKTQEAKDLNQLQGINTVLLYELEWFLSSMSDNQQLNESNQITGEAIADEGSQGISLTTIILIPLSVIIIAVLLTYYFVFLKTDKLYEKDVIEGIERQEKDALGKINIHQEPGDGSRASENELKPISSQSTAQNTAQSIMLIHSLVQQAYDELREGNLESASRTYSHALSFYKASSFKLDDKLKANYEMNTLRERIVEAIRDVEDKKSVL